jgi:hypothetical protein
VNETWTGGRGVNFPDRGGPSRVCKQQLCVQTTRLRGMAKNRCKVQVIAALTNLFLARRLLFKPL